MTSQNPQNRKVRIVVIVIALSMLLPALPYIPKVSANISPHLYIREFDIQPPVGVIHPFSGDGQHPFNMTWFVRIDLIDAPGHIRIHLESVMPNPDPPNEGFDWNAIDQSENRVCDFASLFTHVKIIRASDEYQMYYYDGGNGGPIYINIDAEEAGIYYLYFDYDDTTGTQDILRMYWPYWADSKIIDIHTIYPSNWDENHCNSPKTGTYKTRIIYEILDYQDAFLYGELYPANDGLGNFPSKREYIDDITFLDYQTQSSAYAYYGEQTRLGNPYYINAYFCYRDHSYFDPEVNNLHIATFDININAPVGVNFINSFWYFSMIYSDGWDNPTTNDQDNDGLTDYIEADIGTNPSNLDSPNVALYSDDWNTLGYSWEKKISESYYSPYELSYYAVDGTPPCYEGDQTNVTGVARRGSDIYLYGSPNDDLNILDYFYGGQYTGITKTVMNNKFWRLTIAADAPIGVVSIERVHHSSGGDTYTYVQLLLIFQLPTSISTQDRVCYGYEDMDWGLGGENCDYAAFYLNESTMPNSHGHLRSYTYSLQAFDIYPPNAQIACTTPYMPGLLAVCAAHGATNPIDAAQRCARVVNQRMVWDGCNTLYGSLPSMKQVSNYFGDFHYTRPGDVNPNQWHCIPINPGGAWWLAQNLHPNDLEEDPNNYTTYMAYGQCHDYACILTSFLRAIGIPSRPVSSLGDGNNTTMWSSYHVWTEMYLDSPPQVDDHWYVIDCCDQYIWDNHIHVEESIDSRLDYYRDYKVRNNFDETFTNAIGNRTYTAPPAWNFDINTGHDVNFIEVDDNYPALIDVKSSYNRDDTDIIISNYETTGHLLRNDRDYYKIPYWSGNGRYLGFTFVSIDPNDPANNCAQIWINESNYPAAQPSNNSDIVSLSNSVYLYSEDTNTAWYIVIGSNVPQTQTNEGNYYEYQIYLYGP